MQAMRWVIIATAGILVLFGAVSPWFQERTIRCNVPESFAEALDENTYSLIRVLAFANSASSPLDEDGLTGTYYAMLVSTRAYHEDQQSRLPNCAQTSNAAITQTIIATQDVLALQMAGELTPGSARAQTRLEQARERLNVAWADMAAIFEKVELVGQ